MVLPSNMPNNGMAYCGVYQGSGPMITAKVKMVTVKAEINIDSVPMPNAQPPVRRCFCLAITSRPATSSITNAISATQNSEPTANNASKTSPINAS